MIVPYGALDQNITFYIELEKLPTFGRFFSNSCGELQPSAANSAL